MGATFWVAFLLLVTQNYHRLGVEYPFHPPFPLVSDISVLVCAHDFMNNAVTAPVG